MATYLDQILEHHRDRAAHDRRPLDRLIEEAQQCPPTRGFRAALASRPKLAVISEIKRRSPSKGDLAVDLDPAKMAVEYVTGGAACLSVLTDETFFGGSVADLQAARAACSVPVLRKDFTVSAHDVLDARLMGADCVLLIVAGLHPSDLGDLHALATELGLDVLVEIHDEDELDVALEANADLIGVNQRNLVTFDVDHDRAVSIVGQIPAGIVKVAESGVRDATDARALAAAGYDAVLVGETLVRSLDPQRAVAELIG